MSKHNGKTPGEQFPPGVPPGGRVLHLTGTAAEQLQRELVAKVQPHLNEINQENSGEQHFVTLCFAAAIQKHGVHEVATDLYAPTMELAMRLLHDQQKRAHERAREVFVDCIVTDVPAANVRAAKRAGVDLSQESLTESVIAAAKAPTA